MPFDGLEAYYSSFDKATNDHWYKIAQDKGWLGTGGSDFHGMIKPDLKMGASLCPEKDLQALREFYHANIS